MSDNHEKSFENKRTPRTDMLRAYDSQIVSELPVILALSPRGIDEIAGAAHAVQANVAALRVAWCRHTGDAAASHEIRTPSPGPVRRMREILIEPRVLKEYTFDEISLRLRQVWGEFCALCWLFPHVDPQQPIVFDPLPPAESIRCCADIQTKLAEVQRGLWRLRHEIYVRQHSAPGAVPGLQAEHEIALAMPVSVYGQPVHEAPDEPLLACACEYAGMLAALRWVTDSRWTWEAPGIMDVALTSDGL